MYKIEIEKGNINPNQLHEEIGKLDFPYFLLHNDEKIVIQFSGVNEILVLDEETEEVIETKYSTIETKIEVVVLDDKTEEEKSIKIDVDVTEPFKETLSKIESIVKSHVPKENIQTKSKLEQLEEVVDMLLMDSLGGL